MYHTNEMKSSKGTLKPLKISLKIVAVVFIFIQFSSEIANASDSTRCKNEKKEIVDYLKGLNLRNLDEAKNRKLKQEIIQKVSNWKNSIFSCELSISKVHGTSGAAILHLVAIADDVQTMRQIVSEGNFVDIRMHTSFGELDILDLAVVFNSTEVVNLLLDKETNVYDIHVNKKNSEGITPLHLAVNYSSIPMMELLLANGADINAKDESLTTPLHLSIFNSLFEKAKFLIQKGANVRDKGRFGNTSLHDAARKEKSIPVMRLLLEKGADINATDLFYETPLYYSIKHSKFDNAKFLINNGADVNAGQYPNEDEPYNLSPDHMHVLILAAMKVGSISVMELLLQKGADVNVKFSDFGTPLYASILFRRDDNAKFLIKNGADINAQIRYGTPLLHEAVSATCTTICLYGQNPYKNREEIIQMLLDNNADINIRDSYGRSALHVAVETECLKCAKILVERGINTRLTDRHGRTAYDRAVSYLAHPPIFSSGATYKELIEFLQSFPH